MNIEEAKKDVIKSISHARSSAKDCIKADIDCSDINQLTYVLNNINEAGGMSIMWTRLFPNDSDTAKLNKEITEVRNIGYVCKERYLSLCQCIEKKNKYES